MGKTEFPKEDGMSNQDILNKATLLKPETGFL